MHSIRRRRWQRSTTPIWETMHISHKLDALFLYLYFAFLWQSQEIKVFFYVAYKQHFDILPSFCRRGEKLKWWRWWKATHLRWRSSNMLTQRSPTDTLKQKSIVFLSRPPPFISIGLCLCPSMNPSESDQWRICLSIRLTTTAFTAD